MNSGLIGKVDKAKKYAQERHRMHVSTLQVDFKGENDTHHVALDEFETFQYTQAVNPECFESRHHRSASGASQFLLPT